MFGSISSVQAQERTARIVEVLADDQFIVEISGKEYRAINGEKAIQLAKQKIDLETCRENEKRFTDLITIEKQNVTIAQQQRDIEKLNFVHAMSLYEKERELRVEAQTQFIPHGKAGGFGGKVLNFLDSGYGQSLFKLVIPTATFIKTLKQ